MTTIEAHTKVSESRLKQLLSKAAILVGTPQQQPEGKRFLFFLIDSNLFV
jgi:hypothetical protein